MLGGAQAAREPWRNTFAHLSSSIGWEQVLREHADLDITQFLKAKPIAILQTMAKNGLNSPRASSAGRLFDAVAAAVNVCREKVSFEGQAAIELESLADEYFDQQAEFAYEFTVKNNELNWTPLWSALLKDLSEGVDAGIIAARFHHCVAYAVAQTAQNLCEQYQLSTVILSGGVFQNRLILARIGFLLREQNLKVLSPRATPMNDGGLSVGQAVIAFASGQSC